MLCLERLGKEPWDPTLRADMLYEMYHHSTKSLKEFLLDQSIICGIGNIYANEICFALRKRPQTKMNRISKQSFQQLIDKTKEILEHAICQGGTTIRDYTSQLGVDGRFQVFLMVHGRKNEPCRVCNAPIKKIQWKGRGTYYCPYCQK